MAFGTYYEEDDDDLAPQTSYDNDVARVLDLRKDPQAPLSDNALKLTSVDKDVYHDCVEAYPAMQQNLESGLQEYKPFDLLSEDMFNSLFKYKANLHEQEDVTAYSQFNHQLMAEALESDEYQDLRKHTMFDKFTSAIGTEVMQAKAMEKINHFKEQYRIQKETGVPQDGADAGLLIDQLNNSKATADAINDIMSAAGGAGGLTAEEAKEVARLQKQYRKEMREIQANIDGQNQLSEVSNDLVEAAADASIVVGEIRDTINAWGLETGVSGRRISVEKRRSAVERIRRSERLKDLTDLIGRFREIAKKTKKMKFKGGHSIDSVKTGNDIPSIIPSEWGKLAHPVFKKDFVRRYHQKQLLQYDRQDTVSKGRGPIVFCHDKSGSMGGVPDDWSTALALSTLEVAQKDKRNFAYIPYNGDVMPLTKDIPHGELDPDDVLDIAELNVSGGTNFERPLEKALDFINQSSYKKADIIFVTDGDAPVTDEFLRKFKEIQSEKQFFVHTVLINVSSWGASDSIVKQFSDHVTTISSIADLDGAAAEKDLNLAENSADITDAKIAAAAQGIDLDDDGDFDY